MPVMDRHRVLFEPLEIGPKVLKNRFYQVPQCTGFGTEKPWSQAEHRAVKAEGGWAGVCTEWAPIGPESDEKPFVSARVWSDADAENLAVMCDAVHLHGALAGLELGHSGAHATGYESRLATLAPSQLASDFLPHSVPKAMEQSDIDRVQDEWVVAARRARAAGFDIVYVYGGHSYLPLQFLSPFYNKRTDGYGGSLENRARFWLETLEAVRETVADDCAIAVRFCVEALGPAGVSLDEGLAFIRIADALVDLWDVNVGSHSEWSKDSGSSRFFTAGYQLEWTGRVREATGKPIVGVGRLTDPDQMAGIVRSGVWDLIGAARPSIADPFLPRKIEEGRIDDIRECIGCNICAATSDRFGHLRCTQNATAGEEFRRGWHPEKYTPTTSGERNVLIVGAGLAGIECAIVLGKRGVRHVQVVDKAADIGGIGAWIPRLPGMGEWIRLLDYRRRQLDKLTNVSVTPSVEFDPQQVRTYGADVVVIASGATWARDGICGAAHEPIAGVTEASESVLTPEDVMVHGRRPAGGTVVVYDGEGYFMGSSIAEQLAGEGFAVELVTPLDKAAPFCDNTLEGAFVRQRLHDLGVRVRAQVVLSEIRVDGVRGETVFGDPVEIATDGIVLVTQRVSEDGLYRELVSDRTALRDAGVSAVYRIGDCVAPRLLADVIFDGHRLAREIDSADPGVAAPYRQEGSSRAGRSDD